MFIGGKFLVTTQQIKEGRCLVDGGVPRGKTKNLPWAKNESDWKTEKKRGLVRHAGSREGNRNEQAQRE